MKQKIQLSWLKKISIISLIILMGFLIFPEEAHAFYIDPGTGSIIIQVLIGFVVGGLVALKIFWTKFTLWLKHLFGRPDKNGNQ